MNETRKQKRIESGSNHEQYSQNGCEDERGYSSLPLSFFSLSLSFFSLSFPYPSFLWMESKDDYTNDRLVDTNDDDHVMEWKSKRE